MECYFIIGFQNTIIIIDPSLISLLHKIFSNALQLNICFLQKAKKVFNDLNFDIKYKEIETSNFFNSCIPEFNKKLNLVNQKIPVNQTWLIIRSCISAYLMKNCNKISRIADFFFMNKKKSYIPNKKSSIYR